MLNKLFVFLLGLLFLSPMHAEAVTPMGWTSAQQTNINNAKNSNDPVYTYFINRLNQYPNGLYGDDGLPRVVAYKATGDIKYCQQAASSAFSGGCDTWGTRNDTRDCFVANALAYSQCADVVSSQEKTAWETRLDAVVDKVKSASHGTRSEDSDETQGHYFGCMIYDLAQDGVINKCTDNYYTAGGFGGLTPDNSKAWNYSLRNVIKKQWEEFSGGSFIEGSEYNKSTIRYVLMAVHAINNYFGWNGVSGSANDKFPEITSLFPKIAEYSYQYQAPSYIQHWQWGDVQSNQFRHPFRWAALSLYAAAAFLDNNNANMWHLFDGIYNEEPSIAARLHYMWFYNPTATRTKKSGQTSFINTKQNTIFWHSGWNTNDTFFITNLRRNTWFDHNYDTFDNYALWRNNAWVLDYRRHYYGDIASENNLINSTLLFGGFSRVNEGTGGIVDFAGSDYVYQSGVSSGFKEPNGKNDPVTPFIDENTIQRLFKFDSADKTSLIFNYSRIRACRPDKEECIPNNNWKFNTRLPNEYGRNARLRAIDANFNHVVITHTDTLPVKSGDKFSWTASNGDKVEQYTMVDGYTSEFVNLASNSPNTAPYYFSSQGWNPAEQFGYQLRIKKAPVSTGAMTFYPLLNIVAVGDTQPNFTYTKITSTSSTVEDVIGAMVESPTQRTVALFSSEHKIPSFTSCGGLWPNCGGVATYDPNRYTKAAALHRFSVGGAATFVSDDTKNIDVFIMGLDTTKNWTITRNSVPAGCVVSAQGICRFTIPGASQTHTVSWSASGALTCNQACGLCTDEGSCAGSLQTCYWHDNNGSTTSQCFNYAEPTPAEDDCNDACGLCADETACGLSAQTCFWHDNNGSTDEQCNSEAEPVVPTCDEACNLCTIANCNDSLREGGCYWHDNDGTTAATCNYERERSELCSGYDSVAGQPQFCDTQILCEAQSFCWEDSKCIATCTPPPTYKIAIITPTNDTYLDQASPTTNRNGAGLKVKTYIGGTGGNISVDPSTFTLGGVNSGALSANSTTLTHTGLNDNHTAYAYKDFGAAYFGNFEIKFTVRSNAQNSNSHSAYFCLSNTQDATMGTMNTTNNGICFGFKRDGDDGWFLREYDSGSNASSLVPGVAYETRYVTFTRSSDTCTANVYTNSARTTHASGSPMSISCGSNAKRYMYLASTNGVDGWASSAGSGYIADVTIIGEGTPAETDFVTVLDFDLSNISSQSDLLGAFLYVRLSAPLSASGTINVFKSLREFSESQATWNLYSTGNSWASGGSRGALDYDGTYGTGVGTLASYNITGNETSGTLLQFENTDAFRQLIRDNLGGIMRLVLQAQNSTTEQTFQIYDSENATETNRPILRLHYNPSIIPPDVDPPSKRKRIVNGFLHGRF